MSGEPGSVRWYLEQTLSICERMLGGKSEPEPVCLCGHRNREHAYIDPELKAQLLSLGIRPRGDRPCDRCNHCEDFRKEVPHG